MWTAASMPSRISRAQAPGLNAAISRAVTDPMPGKGEDRAQGLAEQSVNTSIVHPGQNSPDRAEPGDRSAGNRRLTENDQQEGLEKTDPKASQASDRKKP